MGSTPACSAPNAATTAALSRSARRFRGSAISFAQESSELYGQPHPLSDIGDILGDLDEIAVRVAEVDRPQLAERATTRDRPRFDRDADHAQVLAHLVERDRADHAEVAGAERRLLRLRGRLRTSILEVDLLLSELQREPRLTLGAAEELALEAERALVE